MLVTESKTKFWAPVPTLPLSDAKHKRKSIYLFMCSFSEPRVESTLAQMQVLHKHPTTAPCTPGQGHLFRLQIPALCYGQTQVVMGSEMRGCEAVCVNLASDTSLLPAF